jgi:hypothetical protein
MASAPIRDPLADHLITPRNAGFVVIRSPNCRDRLHRPPVEGMSGKSVLMERSRTDHTRDSLGPVCSRPIKNKVPVMQLSPLRLQP